MFKQIQEGVEQQVAADWPLVPAVHDRVLVSGAGTPVLSGIVAIVAWVGGTEDVVVDVVLHEQDR